MKKILIATTALVATAGVASADVSLSGDARMGVIYDRNTPFDKLELNFTSRTRAKITLSGESDGGLSFGGSFDMHNSSDASSGLSGSAFVSGDFGKISMGDVDGAAKAAVGFVDGVGLTGLQDQNEILYVNGAVDVDGDANDDTIYPNPAALYEFNTGAFSLYAGAGDPGGQVFQQVFVDPLTGGVSAVTLFADQTYSLGAKWAGDTFSVGFGYETIQTTASFVTPGNPGGAPIQQGGSVTVNQAVLGGSATFGDFVLKANYGWIDAGGGNSSQYSLSGTYAFDAFSVTAFYSSLDLRGLNTTTDAYGLGAAYDLGGGLSVKGGVVRNRVKDTIADLGVSMSF